jgi:hypothetical protein
MVVATFFAHYQDEGAWLNFGLRRDVRPGKGGSIAAKWQPLKILKINMPKTSFTLFLGSPQNVQKGKISDNHHDPLNPIEFAIRYPLPIPDPGCLHLCIFQV